MGKSYSSTASASNLQRVGGYDGKLQYDSLPFNRPVGWSWRQKAAHRSVIVYNPSVIMIANEKSSSLFTPCIIHWAVSRGAFKAVVFVENNVVLAIGPSESNPFCIVNFRVNTNFSMVKFIIYPLNQPTWCKSKPGISIFFDVVMLILPNHFC